MTLEYISNIKNTQLSQAMPCNSSHLMELMTIRHAVQDLIIFTLHGVGYELCF